MVQHGFIQCCEDDFDIIFKEGYESELAYFVARIVDFLYSHGGPGSNDFVTKMNEICVREAKAIVPHEWFSLRGEVMLRMKFAMFRMHEDLLKDGVTVAEITVDNVHTVVSLLERAIARSNN